MKSIGGVIIDPVTQEPSRPWIGTDWKARHKSVHACQTKTIAEGIGGKGSAVEAFIK